VSAAGSLFFPNRAAGRQFPALYAHAIDLILRHNSSIFSVLRGGRKRHWETVDIAVNPVFGVLTDGPASGG
jgi:hypothetical protein